MSKFRSALDFYLNESFDLNKVLTFIRYDVHFAKSSLVHATEDKEETFQKTFGQLEDLVDITALFSFITERLGTRTMIDPVSRQDPILNLIEFFCDKNVNEIGKLSS